MLPAYFTKLVKIRFTAWSDQPVVSRPAALQRQLDYWNTRVSVLSSEAEAISAGCDNANSDALQNSLATVAAALQRIETARASFLCAESSTHEANAHYRVGTIGYQVCNDWGTHVLRVVDEVGGDLPETAVFSYAIVED